MCLEDVFSFHATCPVLEDKIEYVAQGLCSRRSGVLQSPVHACPVVMAVGLVCLECSSLRRRDALL